MNRRDFLRSSAMAGVAIALPVSLLIKESFIEIGSGHPLFDRATAYLNGQRLDHAFAATVTMASFKRSAPGSLLVCVRDTSGRHLREDERSLRRDEAVSASGHIARRVKGDVYLKVI